MQLIERYIEAVKFWLPKAQQEDIAAELHTNILAQAEDREAALGRPLQEDEEVAILKQLGPPPLVAARYRPDQGTVAFGRQWIGPLVYPFYRVAVKATLSILALLELLSAATRVVAGRTDIVQAIIQAAWQLLDVAIMPLLLVTIAFAVIDYALREYRLAERWDPRTLPALKRRKQVVPRANSIAAIVIQLVFIVWWLSLPSFSEVTFGQLRPAPIWQTLYLPSLFIACVILAQNVATFLRPTWIWLAAAAELLTSIASLVILYPLLQAHPLVLLDAVDPSALDQLKMVKLNTGIHFALISTWLGILIVALVQAVRCLRFTRDLFARQHRLRPRQL